MIQGEELYIAAKVEKQPHGEEAFGFSFEKMVLFAWSLGIGTTWIGGTLDRPHFEKTAGVKERERMYGVSPLGYPAGKMSEVDIRLRGSVRGNKFHFYEKHTKHYDAETYGDVQKIDMGIALRHFMSVTDGKLAISDPGIAIGEDMEYIAMAII